MIWDYIFLFFNYSPVILLLKWIFGWQSNLYGSQSDVTSSMQGKGYTKVCCWDICLQKLNINDSLWYLQEIWKVGVSSDEKHFYLCVIPVCIYDRCGLLLSVVSWWCLLSPHIMESTVFFRFFFLLLPSSFLLYTGLGMQCYWCHWSNWRPRIGFSSK